MIKYFTCSIYSSPAPVSRASRSRGCSPCAGCAWRSRSVIGADGARSAVARQLGLDRNAEFLVGLEDVLPGKEPGMHCFLDPRLAPGYIAWVVDDGEERHAGVAGYRDRFDPADA